MDTVNQIISGDALRNLRKLPDNYFQCCIASPPYWGLRDYGIPYQISAESELEVDEYIMNLSEIFSGDSYTAIDTNRDTSNGGCLITPFFMTQQ